jgi:hypothetical protein
MRVFKKKTACLSVEDVAFAERLSAITGRGKGDLCPVNIIPEPPVVRQTIPQLFFEPAELLAESACE